MRHSEQADRATLLVFEDIDLFEYAHRRAGAGGAARLRLPTCAHAADAGHARQPVPESLMDVDLVAQLESLDVDLDTEEYHNLNLRKQLRDKVYAEYERLRMRRCLKKLSLANLSSCDDYQVRSDDSSDAAASARKGSSLAEQRPTQVHALISVLLVVSVFESSQVSVHSSHCTRRRCWR